MNNFLSYCVLIDARIGAFEKDLPVHTSFLSIDIEPGCQMQTSDFQSQFSMAEMI